MSSQYLEPYNGPREEPQTKSSDERIADSLEKIVKLLDYQNKMLTTIATAVRKGK